MSYSVQSQTGGAAPVIQSTLTEPPSVSYPDSVLHLNTGGGGKRFSAAVLKIDAAYVKATQPVDVRN